MKHLLQKVTRLEAGTRQAMPCPTCGHWSVGSPNRPPMTFKLHTGQPDEEPFTGPRTCTACGRVLWFTFEMGPSLKTPI